MASTLTDAQEQLLGLVRESQQAALKAVSSWTEQTAKLVPSTPDLPFSELYAKPAEVVDSGFELAQQLLSSQREFVKELLETTNTAEAPVAPKTTTKSSK
jgi:hypothetical protein